MAAFSCARLVIRRSLEVAAPRAASLGAGLRRATEEPSSRRLLHGQLLPRFSSSDASGSNGNKHPLPFGSEIAADLKLHHNFNRNNIVRPEYRGNTQVNFNYTDNGTTMFKTAMEEKSFNSGQPRLFAPLPFTASHIFNDRIQSSVPNKRDFVHVLLKKKKTFVTVTDSKGNRKTGASAGCLEDRKGRSRLSKYSAEATAEHVGRSARKMGLRSVVVKVKGAAFFRKKKKVILGWREGFRGERVRDQSPIIYIHDVTQLPHNGCRLRKQRRI